MNTFKNFHYKKNIDFFFERDEEIYNEEEILTDEFNSEVEYLIRTFQFSTYEIQSQILFTLSVLFESHYEIYTKFENSIVISNLINFTKDISIENNILSWKIISHLTNYSQICVSFLYDNDFLKIVTNVIISNSNYQILKYSILSLHHIASLNSEFFKSLLRPIPNFYKKISPINAIMTTIENNLNEFEILNQKFDNSNEELNNIRKLLLKFLLAIISYSSKNSQQPPFLSQVISIIFKSLIFDNIDLLKLSTSGCEKCFEEFDSWIFDEYFKYSGQSKFLNLLSHENFNIRYSILSCFLNIFEKDQEESINLFNNGFFDEIIKYNLNNEN